MKKRMFRMPLILRCLAAVLCAVMIYGGLYLLEHQGGLVIDLTPDALTSLSEGTLDTLGKLEEEVHIHLVFREDNTSPLRQTLEILTDSYQRVGGGKLSIDVVDPVTEPGRIRAFAQSGKSIAEGSVIVTNGDESRFAVVAASELYTYAVTSTGSLALTGFTAEQELTAAIRTVTGEDAQRVFFLQGHDEAGMAACSVLVNRLESDNYAVAEHILLQDDALRGGDVLLVLSPARDLTDGEAAALDDFLLSGGRLLLAMDASLDMTGMPRFADLAEGFSLTFEPGMAVEDERMTGYWMNSPLYLMPRLVTDSEAMAALREDQRVIIPGARAVSGPAMPLSGCTYESLLVTSDLAYICPLDSESIAYAEGMKRGAQQLAVSVRRTDESTGAEIRAVLMGSLYTLLDNSLLNSTYNLDMTMSVIGYLAQREAEVAVPVRDVTDASMPALTAREGWQMTALTLVLPLLSVLVGAAVLIRRRKK